MAGYPPETETEESGQFQVDPPLRVHIESSDASPVKPVAPEYGTCRQIPIAQTGNQPTMICQRRLRRVKANLVIRTVTSATVTVSSNPADLTLTPPQGATFQISGNTTNTSFPDWISQQALYAISTQADTTIGVLDTSYEKA